MLPAALQLRKDDAELDALLDREATEKQVRTIVEDFNRRIVEARRQLQGGPPVVTPTRDVDAEVERWRERRRPRRRTAEPGPCLRHVRQDALVAALTRLVPTLDVTLGSAHAVVMTAYWISIYQEIVDEAKVAAYAELAGPALRAAGGTFIARGLPEQVYEAGVETRTVLIEFDSVEAARAAHESPDYQEALAALDGGAVRDLRIVPGVD